MTGRVGEAMLVHEIHQVLRHKGKIIGPFLACFKLQDVERGLTHFKVVAMNQGCLVLDGGRARQPGISDVALVEGTLPIQYQ